MQRFIEAHQFLNGLMSETRVPRHAYTLERIKTLMDFLGNPQNTYQVIHVAGTSGKTSTCYYLSAFLKAAGKRVGLSISPHIEELNERVQINGRPLSEKAFMNAFGQFRALVAKSGVKPTYFEFLVAFMFWEFARQKVEYAVVEVGLGGLLDATNVMDRSDKVCVITDIGYDHVATLGETLTAITSKKAGIILPTNVVFSYDQAPEVMAVLREVCAEQKAQLHEVWPLKSAQLPASLPLFQGRNWYLAFSVYASMSQARSFPDLSEAQLARTAGTFIPARMEVLHAKGKIIILDGAHNTQKLTALAESLKHAYPTQSIACVAAFIRTKQTKIAENLGALLPAISHLIATDFYDESTQKASVDPLALVDACEAAAFHAWEHVPGPQKALGRLLRRPEEVLLVTGSLYLLNHLRPLMLKEV